MAADGYLFEEAGDDCVLQGRDVLHQILLLSDKVERGCHDLRELEWLEVCLKGAVQVQQFWVDVGDHVELHLEGATSNTSSVCTCIYRWAIYASRLALELYL